MKFNLEIKDLLPTGKIKTTPNEQELVEWEDVSDEEAAAINGGINIISASTTSTFSLEEYYKYAGYWGG
ncbi:hypothetical protein [Fischerella sp. PCC 9605]|uniref:hypothetical protein n=1 Tax=Fischerella sp. PCC 9605 TaxID=1173024 RepID=UPI00047C325C|nr:hypothetical protein [Fischerella sp. PCC 9605]